MPILLFSGPAAETGPFNGSSKMPPAASAFEQKKHRVAFDGAETGDSLRGLNKTVNSK
jgi:hypothetical protein